MIGLSWLSTCTTSSVSLAAPVPLPSAPPLLMIVVCAGAGQRLGDGGGDLGQHLQRLDRETRLVVELQRLGQQTPRLGLGLALGLDRLGLGQTDLAAHHRFGLGLGQALGLDAPRRPPRAACGRPRPPARPGTATASARRSASYFWASAFSRTVAFSSSFCRSTSFSAIWMFWTFSSISPAFWASALATSTSRLIEAFFSPAHGRRRRSRCRRRCASAPSAGARPPPRSWRRGRPRPWRSGPS